MKTIIFFCLVTITMSAPLALEKEWQNWKQEHSKSYSDDVEESIRRAVWFRAYNHIKEHNSASSHTYQLALNALSDLVR